MDSSTRIEQRKLKFSRSSAKRILDDPLKDESLISRGSSSNLLNLQRDQSAREQLLSRIKKLQDGHTFEHGLRKLREVTLSVFDENKQDPNFIALVHQVYQLSYEYFFKKQDFAKLGNLVFNPMFHNFPENSFFQQLYALYASHVESDLSKCISILTYDTPSHIPAQERQLIRLSSIYLANLESPSQWFYILSRLPKNQLQFLTSIPAFKHMKDRCFQYLKICYNQISLDYSLRSWFYGMIEESDIPNDWPLETIRGTQTLVFKGRRKT